MHPLIATLSAQREKTQVIICRELIRRLFLQAPEPGKTDILCHPWVGFTLNPVNIRTRWLLGFIWRFDPRIEQ